MDASELGRAMRAIPSEKRDAAIRRNIAIARASRVLKPCTCHVARSDGTHESSCCVYMRLKQQERRAKQ